MLVVFNLYSLEDFDGFFLGNVKKKSSYKLNCISFALSILVLLFICNMMAIWSLTSVVAAFDFL